MSTLISVLGQIKAIIPEWYKAWRGLTPEFSSGKISINTLRAEDREFPRCTSYLFGESHEGRPHWPRTGLRATAIPQRAPMNIFSKSSLQARPRARFLTHYLSYTYISPKPVSGYQLPCQREKLERLRALLSVAKHIHSGRERMKLSFRESHAPFMDPGFLCPFSYFNILSQVQVC